MCCKRHAFLSVQKLHRQQVKSWYSCLLMCREHWSRHLKGSEHIWQLYFNSCVWKWASKSSRFSAVAWQTVHLWNRRLLPRILFSAFLGFCFLVLDLKEKVRNEYRYSFVTSSYQVKIIKNFVVTFTA